MKKLSLVFALLLVFALFANSTLPLPPQGDFYSEIFHNIRVAIYTLGTPVKTGTVIIEENESIGTRKIAINRNLAEEQICITLGPLENETWETIEEGHTYRYVGEKGISFRAYVLCDLQNRLSADIKEMNPNGIGDFKEEYFSACRIDSDSNQTMCLVVFNDEDLKLGVQKQTRGIDIFSFPYSIIFIALIPFAIALILSGLILSKTKNKKLKSIFIAKTIMYVALFLSLLGQMFQIYTISFLFALIFFGNVLFQPILSYLAKTTANKEKDPQNKKITITLAIDSIYLILIILMFLIANLPSILLLI